MNHEVIEVCQDCGHVIEPEILTAPWGDRYRFTLCLCDECIADRLAAAPLWASEPIVRSPHWMYPPIVNDPNAMIRVTGV